MKGTTAIKSERYEAIDFPDSNAELEGQLNTPGDSVGSDRVASPRWFAQDQDKAKVEKFFLIYSPVWMISMAVMMLTGWDKQFGDIALLIHATTVALPLLIVPWLLWGRASTQPFHQSYWFKANLYIFVFGFFGNYFGSEYFFDVLGMVYVYPNATTVLDSSLLGSGDQSVPLIMYLYTHAYFMTYHTSAMVVLRRILTSGFARAAWLFLPLVLAIGYVWAWLETKAMANPLMVSSFYYENMEAMLAYGSLIYALYFVASFPIFYFIDEKPSQRWSLTQVMAAALSASMIVFYLLDISAHWVGQL